MRSLPPLNRNRQLPRTILDFDRKPQDEPVPLHPVHIITTELYSLDSRILETRGMHSPWTTPSQHER